MKKLALIVFLTLTGSMTAFAQWQTDAPPPNTTVITNNPSTASVGIGAGTPLSLFHVRGTLTVGSGATAGSVGNLQLFSPGVSPVGNRLTFGTDGTGWKFAIAKNQGGTVSDLLTIQDNGNVGIGTTAPGTLLHLLQSGTAVESLRLDNPLGGADLANRIGFYQGGNQNGYVDSHYDATNGWALRFGTRNAGNTAADRMIITNSGNVGIGTMTPSQKLGLAGNLQLSTGGSIYGDTTAPELLLNTAAGSYLRYTASNFVGVGGGIVWFFAGSGSEAMRITGNNVGIGTTAPNERLSVAGNVQLTTGGTLYGDTAAQSLSLNSIVGSKLSFDGNNYVWVGGNVTRFGTNPGESMRLWNGMLGVGLGMGLPSSSLQVAGDMRFGSNGTNTDVRLFTDTAGQLNTTTYGQINSMTPTTVPGSGVRTYTALHLKNATASGQGTNQFDLVVDGSITASSVIGAVYQDVAEWVPSRELSDAGTVVVVDPDATNGVLPSSAQYQTTVAGVVSAAPGVILGVGGPSREKIATTGRVKVRASAANGPIRAGDLLVTSDTPGVAMRSEPINVQGIKMHRPGTLIGKALEPLPSGEGEILTLLSLQ